MATLTDAEKERCRYHLGYQSASFSGALQLGVPRPIQTIFIVEQALNLLVDQNSIDRVRRILSVLDEYEKKLQDAACNLQVEQVGNIKMRGAKAGETYPDLLEREYVRWAQRLADLLGVPLYRFSERFSGLAASGSIPVRGC